MARRAEPMLLENLPSDNVRKTRSGRISVPPMAYWLGERIITTNTGTKEYLSPTIAQKGAHLVPKNTIERQSLNSSLLSGDLKGMSSKNGSSTKSSETASARRKKTLRRPNTSVTNSESMNGKQNLMNFQTPVYTKSKSRRSDSKRKQSNIFQSNSSDDDFTVSKAREKSTSRSEKPKSRVKQQVKSSKNKDGSTERKKRKSLRVESKERSSRNKKSNVISSEEFEDTEKTKKKPNLGSKRNLVDKKGHVNSTHDDLDISQIYFLPSFDGKFQANNSDLKKSHKNKTLDNSKQSKSFSKIDRTLSKSRSGDNTEHMFSKENHSSQSDIELVSDLQQQNQKKASPFKGTSKLSDNVVAVIEDSLKMCTPGKENLSRNRKKQLTKRKSLITSSCESEETSSECDEVEEQNIPTQKAQNIREKQTVSETKQIDKEDTQNLKPLRVSKRTKQSVFYKTKCTKPEEKKPKLVQKKLQQKLDTFAIFEDKKQPGKNTLKRKTWVLNKLNVCNSGHTDDLFEGKQLFQMKSFLQHEKTLDSSKQPASFNLKCLTPKVSYKLQESPALKRYKTSGCATPSDFNCNRNAANAYIYQREKSKKTKAVKGEVKDKGKMQFTAEDTDIAKQRVIEILAKVPGNHRYFSRDDLKDYHISNSDDDSADSDSVFKNYSEDDDE